MPLSMRTLSRGMTGRDVADVQAALNYHLRPPTPPHTPPGPPRPPLKPDGNFGPQTDARLREFQTLNDLEVDGIVGHETRPELFGGAKIITMRVPITKLKEQPNAPAVNAFAAAPTIGQSQPAPQPTPLIAPVLLQNRQLQLGGNLTLDPVVGPGAASKAFFLAVQWTWVEQKDGRHIELALGAQIATGLSKDPMGLAASAQSFGQFAVADVLAFDPIKLHVFSPSLQVAYQSNFVQGVLRSNSIGVSAQNQVAWDLEKRGNNAVLSIFCQQQLGWTYDLTARKGTIAPSFLLGATWTANFF